VANFADAIFPAQNLGGAVSFPVGYLIEEAAQTFALGTPLMVKTSTDGGLQAWDGTFPNLAGISMEAGNNLGSTGSGAPVGFSPILGPGSVVGNYAANPNQASAVITPPMTPMSDGRIRFWIASPGTVFIAKLGTSATNTPVATTNQIVGTAKGLAKDPGNAFWFVDTNATNAVQIVALSPLEAVGTSGGHVLFVVLPSAVASIYA
jgi:hypothetical protein